MKWKVCAGIVAGVLVASVAWGEEGAGGDRYAPSRVTVEVKDGTVREVLEEMAKQSGNRVPYLYQGVGDRRVSLTVKDATYWQAMATLCKNAGLGYWQGEVGEGTMPERLSAVAGVVWVRVEGTEAVQELRRERRGRSGTEPAPTRLYRMACSVEDRLGAIAVKGETTKVIVGGKEMKVLGETGSYRGSEYPNKEAVWGRMRPHGSFYVLLGELPAGTKVLGRVEGKVKAQFGVGMKEIAFEDALSGKEQEGKDEQVTVKLKKSYREGNDTMVELETTSEGMVVVADGVERYGVYLEDEEGTRKMGRIMGFDRDRTKEMERRKAVQEARRAGKPVPAAAPEAEKGPTKGTLSVAFYKLPEDGGKMRLIYVHPEKEETREFGFVIENVPVP